MNSLVQVVEQVVRGIQGAVFAVIDYSIPAKAYLRAKAEINGVKVANPYWKRVDDIRCEHTNIQINLGVIYQNAVNGRLERKEIEPTFNAEAMQGKVPHINPHKLLCQSTDRSKTYLRYMPMKSHQSSTIFTLDGQDITDALRPFMAPQKDESKRQEDAGLNKQEQIVWRTLTLDNIKSLRVLGAEYTM